MRKHREAVHSTKAAPHPRRRLAGRLGLLASTLGLLVFFSSTQIASAAAPSKGATGPTGPTGATGATGAKGATGANGVTGATGANGKEGAKGATGANGVNGVNGATGATGPEGRQGNTGPTGNTEQPEGSREIDNHIGSPSYGEEVECAHIVGDAPLGEWSSQEQCTQENLPRHLAGKWERINPVEHRQGPTGMNGIGVTGERGPTGENGVTGATGTTGATALQVLSIEGTATEGHIVQGTGRAATLSGAAKFSSTTSYTCYGSDLTSPSGVVTFNYISGTELEALAPGSDQVRFVCTGT
jgi:Collagen triple helix repeat (20 copies)